MSYPDMYNIFPVSIDWRLGAIKFDLTADFFIPFLNFFLKYSKNSKNQKNTKFSKNSKNSKKKS
jgi:hypothetical protein